MGAFIHFHTLSYDLEGFTCFYIIYMLLYACIHFYMLSYTFISFPIFAYPLLYAFICFYLLLYAKKAKRPLPLLRHLHHPKAQPLRGWQKLCVAFTIGGPKNPCDLRHFRYLSEASFFPNL